jgi:putative ABC transport system permease protein
MSLPVRWRKLLRDFNAVQSRVLMAAAAIAVGIFAVSTISTAYAILTCEIARNYVATNPGSALIDLGAVNTELVSRVMSRPDIASAEAGSIISARVEYKPDEWVRMLLFVVPDFSELRVNKVYSQAGAYPPPEGTILLEREALKFLGVRIGDEIHVQTPTGAKTRIRVSGTVHDPSLAPAWQEQTAYGYVTPATLIQLGGSATPEILKVVVRDALHDQAKVDATVTRLAQDLRKQGYSIHQIQTPPTGRHPHQSQMTAVLSMFIVFAVLALALSAVLTASMIDGLLAQQVRQIAVMKAIGARSPQIAALYLSGILAIAALAVAVGLPLGVISGRAFSDLIGQLLNFDIASHAVPPSLIGGLVAVGLFMPLGFAAIPIQKATRITVREALSDYGVSRYAFGGNTFDKLLARLSGSSRTLILGIRNSFRRPGRLVLTLALLGAAGGMFLASLGVQRAWSVFVATSAHDRDYDLELRFDQPANTRQVLATLDATPGVARSEPWNVSPAARARPDGLTVVHTYPDGGHGSLEFRSLPTADRLAHLVYLEGGATKPGDDDSVLINQGARRLLGDVHFGDWITLTLDGRPTTFRVAGVVRQILGLPAVYASTNAYQRATGTDGLTNAVRIVTDRHDARSISEAAVAAEARLAAVGVRVTQSISETQYDRAVGGHVRILVVSLIVMSVLMAVVGLLGLASALGTAVSERTREFGVMRTIGATQKVIIRNVVAEGVFAALLSIALAIILAVPLAAGIGRLVGTLSFGLPLPLILSTPALGIWLTITTVGAALASFAPALNAARLTVRETLAHT